MLEGPLKDKKAKPVFHSFIEIVDKFKPKLNKLSIDQRRESSNSFMQKWLWL